MSAATAAALVPAPGDSLLRTHPLDALAAIIMYASTLYMVPHAAFAIGAALIVFRHGVKFKQRDLLLVVFVIGALANVLFHTGEQAVDSAISSIGVPLVVLTVMAGRALPQSVLNVLILLVCLEIPVGLFEFASGRIALTEAQAAIAFQDITARADLLYERRVLGLSANSSVFAEKLFIGVLLTMASNFRTRTKYAILACLMVGLYITFNRTAIIATALFLAARLLFWGLQSQRRLPLVVVVFAIGAGLLYEAIQPIIDQFTRGTGGSTYSEMARVQYLSAALDKLIESPFFGNGSLNWSVYDRLAGAPQHAHNSVMMLLVEHGFLLGAVFLTFVFMGLRRETALYVFVMFVFSLSQYFFFWNMSLADLILHHFTRHGRDVEALKRDKAMPVMPWKASAFPGHRPK